MKKLIGILTFTAVVSINISLAQSATPDTMTRNFIMAATFGGLQEVNSGNLAVKKGSSSDIRAFGARMIKDHTEANAQLMEIAKAKGYEVPPQARVVVADKMLSKTIGREFDQNYVDMMSADHRKTVFLFQNYSVNGKDPALKAFAQQTLPTIKGHLAAIRAIALKMKNEPK
jgi:putative membrane protein